MSVQEYSGSTSDSTFDPFAGPAILATAPSTEPQREIWAATLLGSEASLAYNESVSIHIQGILNIAALSASLKDLVDRHESLRTTFSADGTTLCLLATMDASLVVRDISAMEKGAREQLVAEHCAAVVEEPFDLEKGPLFRVTLFCLSADEYLLTFTAHHIVFDGYSTGVLITEWGHLYSARKNGTTAELKPAEAFSDYAHKERVAAESPERMAHERYWIDQYPGEVPVLEVPYDRPRPTIKTYASRRIDLVIGNELIRDIKKVGAKQGASLFATLLSAFGVLVSRLSGQTDVVIGIPAAGQSVGEHDTLVGHCVNMLPLRGNFDPGQTVKSLLGSVRRQVLDAYDHQEYTFGSLLKKLSIPRDPSRLPLVSVVFNLDRGFTADSLHFDGLTVSVRANPRHFENFDMFVNAVDMRDHVILEIQYNTDLFDASTISKWFDFYSCLLQSMVANAESPIGDLRFLSDAEQATIDAWNNNCVARLKAQCVHDLIEAQVDRTPDAIAVQFENKQISYRELDSRANQLARRLQQLGVTRDVLVGLCLERSIEMIIAMLAVHKAGGGYVPLDPGYPRDRLSYMVEDSAMPVLVTDSRLREDLQLPATHVVCIDTEADSLAGLSTRRLTGDEAAATADSLAYVIYTSGSTGKPKGVLIEHRSVVNLIGSLHVTPGLTSSDVVLAITTLSFDIAVSELILPLTTGAKILLTSRDIAADGARLMQTIAEGNVTFIDATPATYRLLLAAGWNGDKKLRIICTGEAMPRDLALDLVPRVGQVWNGYGPTETTVWSTFYEVRPPVGRILIGRPVDNTQIYILDPRGHQVPIGVTGEMFIGGAGLARGYLNRAELTAERFVPDPFSKTPGARMYKTGDLARYLPDGNIECLGRNDTQVKLRGFRIELGEIENALTTHPNIASAAVIVREDRPGDKRLCAYFVTRGEVSEADLRAHLRLTLPDYMVPQHYTALDRMPLTPSGKIDRKVLPAPSGEIRGSDVYVEPTTASERLVAELWKQALVISRISASDDFFALGGHSLLASQILARLRVEHGIAIPFRKMFEAPTISAFARIIDELGGASTSATAQVIPKVTNKHAAQLSLNQERIWRLSEMDPNAWRPQALPAAWRLKGNLNVQCLRRALQFFVDRHDLMRASFHLVDGKPVQRVAQGLEFQLQEMDISTVPADEREAKLTHLFDQDVETPYDLEVAPLLRAILIRLDENEHVLYSSRHNIIWDGWSFDIFLRDLSAAYSAFCKGESPELPDLQISYSDFAEWHREWLKGPEHEKQLAYWKTQLQGDIAPVALPTDRAAPKARTHVGANAMLNVTSAEAEQLTAIGHECGATLYTVLLSAFAALLHRYTGQKELLIGTPIRARTRPEVEDVLGPFVNTLALRFKIDPAATFLDLIAQARDTTLDAFSHQESPLEGLGAKAPAVRHSFSLQDARTRPTTFGDLEISQQHVMHRSAVNDLTLWAMHSTKSLLVVVNYSTELFNESTIRYFLEAYRTLLRSILSNPKAELRQLAVNSEEAIELARRAGQARSETATPTPLGARINSVASASATAPALHEQSRVLSYGQLCQSLRSAGATLQAQGVQHGSPVVVLGRRNTSTCIALLGAMNLGAQVILVDPEWPASLVAGILDADSKSFVVTDERVRTHHSESFERVAAARRVDLESFKLGEDAGSSTCPEFPVPIGAIAMRVPYVGENAELEFSHVGYEELLAITEQLASRLSLKAAHRVLCIDEFASFAWVAATLAGLTAGATICMADGDEDSARADVDGEWLESVAATTIVGPSDSLAAACALPNWRAPVSHLIATGHPAAGTRLDVLRRRAPEVYNAFASAEGGAFVCVGQVCEATARYRIGSAIGTASIRILDNLGRDCPIGVPGKLHLAQSNGRDTDTGVVARLLGDGSFECESFEHDAWIHGHRVPLRGMERMLMKHAAVLDAAVLVVDRDNDTSVLVGYVCPKPGVTYTETELRKYLRSTLPGYLVPQDFIEVSSIPRRADGLPVADKLPSSYVHAQRECIPPRTGAERTLAEVWRAVLKVDEVSVTDNFFDIGGHSLLCFQVIDDVQRKTQIRLSPRALLLDTLEQVAKALDGAPPPARSPVPVQEANEGSFGSKLFGKLRKMTGV